MGNILCDSNFCCMKKTFGGSKPPLFSRACSFFYANRICSIHSFQGYDYLSPKPQGAKFGPLYVRDTRKKCNVYPFFSCKLKADYMRGGGVHSSTLRSGRSAAESKEKSYRSSPTVTTIPISSLDRGHDQWLN